MKRLLTLCLLLTVTLSVSAFASISIGRIQPALEAIRRWQMTDCAMPCLAGITPNLTTWDGAVDHMARWFSDYGVREPDGRAWRWAKRDEPVGRGNMILIGAAGSGSPVSSVHIFGADRVETMPTLGELVALWGSPDCMTVDSGLGYLVLYYEWFDNLRIAIGTLGSSYTTHAQYIEISATAWNCQTDRTRRWRGFRSIEFYLAGAN